MLDGLMVIFIIYFGEEDLENMDILEQALIVININLVLFYKVITLI